MFNREAYEAFKLNPEVSPFHFDGTILMIGQMAMIAMI
jgi:hypothetical protein